MNALKVRMWFYIEERITHLYKIHYVTAVANIHNFWNYSGGIEGGFVTKHSYVTLIALSAQRDLSIKIEHCR